MESKNSAESAATPKSPPKKGLFAILGGLFHKTTQTVEEMATATTHSVANAMEMTENAVEAAGEMAGKAAQGAMEMTGKTIEAVGGVAGKTAQAIGSGLHTLGEGLVHSARFLTDTQYRHEVVYPAVQKALRENWARVDQEFRESQEMLLILWKYAHGKPISEEEQKAAQEQMMDLIKVVPALGIFALPGGAILLPLLARALPWSLMPSAFQQKVKEQYGEQALQEELKPDESVPVDASAGSPGTSDPQVND